MRVCNSRDTRMTTLTKVRSHGVKRRNQWNTRREWYHDSIILVFPDGPCLSLSLVKSRTRIDNGKNIIRWDIRVSIFAQGINQIRSRVFHVTTMLQQSKFTPVHRYTSWGTYKVGNLNVSYALRNFQCREVSRNRVATILESAAIRSLTVTCYTLILLSVQLAAHISLHGVTRKP